MLNKRCGKEYIIFIILLGFLISSCASKEPVPIKSAPKEADSSPQSISKHACDNIFYPFSLDNQWIYRIEYGTESDTTDSSDFAITVSGLNESSTEISTLDYGTSIVTKTEVQCQEGAILYFPLTELNMVMADLKGGLNVAHQSGVFMPSEVDFESSDWSNTWETGYSASGEMEANFDGENFRAALSESPINMNWRVVSQGEFIQTPAGEFSDVIRIQREINIDVESFEAVIEGSAINISTTLTIQMDMFYAPGIGLVQEDITSAKIKLFGIDFPVEANGKMILTSYSIAD
jgi:hypothetical protein